MSMKDAFGLWRMISEQRRCYSDVWRLGAFLTVQRVKVEYEPAETNLDETIEESFEDKNC